MARGGLFGFLYAIALVGLSQGWLASWSPWGLVVVGLYLSLFTALALGLAALGIRLMPRASIVVVPALWISLEYLRSHGPLAYPFALVGLTQYQNPFVLGLARLGGVWLVGFFVVGANVLGARLVHGLVDARPQGAKALFSALRPLGGQTGGFLVLLALGLLLGQGALGPSPGPGGSPVPTLKVGLIQHAPPRRQKGPEDYQRSFASLKAQSEAALAQGAELLVWPESAIVPSLNWHLTRRPDREVADFTLEVDRYISALPGTLVFGNDRAEPGPGAGGEARRDWNAAILAQGQRRGVYKKTRLVPLAEEVPGFLKGTKLATLILAKADGGWEAGEGPLAQDLGGLRLGTPICFEDCFGDYCAGFAKAGARLLLVLTSDAWAQSNLEQNQHLAQSVFRAVETGLPVVRAAATGETAFIDPAGHITARLPPGTAGNLVVQVSLPEPRVTPYLRVGEAWVLVLGALALTSLLACGRMRSRATR